MQPSRTLHLIEVCELGVVDGRACCPEMPFRHMEINGSGLKIGMAQQCLHRWQIGSAFHQMSRKTMYAVGPLW